MLDAEHLKAILGKYDDHPKFDLSSRVAISKGRIKSQLKSPPPSLIDDLELTPTIFFDGAEYSLYKQENGWYLYRGPALAVGQGKYRWFTCNSRESDAKQYAAKPYRKSVNTLSRIDEFWNNTLSGNYLWTELPEDEFDWELYRKPIYEIIDKNFFKRKPAAE